MMIDATVPGLRYARVTEYVAPMYTLVPAPSQSGASSYHMFFAFVPIDDENTWVYAFDYSLKGEISEEHRAHIRAWFKPITHPGRQGV